MIDFLDNDLSADLSATCRNPIGRQVGGEKRASLALSPVCRPAERLNESCLTHLSVVLPFRGRQVETDRSRWRSLLLEALVGTVADLEREGVQPTARQVSRSLGLHEGGAKSMLLSAVADGLLVVAPERIELARGSFPVYRVNPAVRVPYDPSANRTEAQP